VRLLLDEMHSMSVAKALRGSGFDAQAVTASDVLRGLDDADLLGAAGKAGQVLVTENVSDFAKLHVEWMAAGRTHSGIVLTHPKRFRRADGSYHGTLLTALIKFHEGVDGQFDDRLWWLEP